MEKMERIFAFYTRVSTEEQATKEGSLVSQAQRLKEYLRFQGIPNNSYFVYQDEGTGKDTNRPGYQNLIADIRKGEIKAVICTEISRISRSVIDFQQFLEICKEFEVDFVSLREKIDTTSAHGKLILGIFASLAQFESEQISERTSANLQARLKRGLFNGGFLYGYKPRAEQKGHLDVEEKEAEIVRKIYEKYLEWHSYSKIADWLNSKGYSFRGGKRWHKNTVLTILRNPSYIAKRRLERELFSMNWAPIIEEKIWNEAQKILDSKPKMQRRHSEKHCFLFRSLLYCGHCQILLESSSGINHQGKKYFYYRHSSKNRKPGCGLRFCYPAQSMEEMLYKSLVMNLSDRELIEKICGQVYQKMKEDIEESKKEAKAIEQELSRIEKETASLIQRLSFMDELHIKEFITPRFNILHDRKVSLEDRKAILQNEIYKLEQETINPKQIEEMVLFLSQEFLEMEEEDKQKILSLIVERIEIHGDNLLVTLRVYNKIRSLTKKGSTPNWLPEHTTKRTFFWIRKAWFWIKKENKNLFFSNFFL